MGHAATATSNYAENGERAFSALVRLRQGGSARATWVLEEAPGGTMISVGTDAACDWQIRAAFVPPRAFSVLVVGGCTFVRSGPEPGLLINGKPADDGWIEVPSTTRIDIGLARFEIQSGHGDFLAEHPVLELAPAQAETQHIEARQAEARHAEVRHAEVRHGETLRTPARHAGRAGKGRRSRLKDTVDMEAPGVGYGRRPRVIRDADVSLRGRGERAVQEAAHGDERLTTAAAAGKRGKLRNSTIELNFDDLDYVGTLPLSRAASTGEYAVSPTLLGDDERTAVTGQSRSWRYALFGALSAGAYGGWIYLLDHM